jgi:hypothetical protein
MEVITPGAKPVRGSKLLTFVPPLLPLELEGIVNVADAESLNTGSFGEVVVMDALFVPPGA